MTDSILAEPRTGFAALGLDPRLVAAVAELGYDEPTPIQREAIPVVRDGKDLIGLAATGTGKTAAFTLPLLHRLAASPDRARPSVLILVPTRELCLQVAEAARKYGRPVGATVAPVYGGAGFSDQARSLRRGVDIVVATPGRALDHIRRETLNLAGIAAVVLDEADEMLDMGFAEDLEAILSATPKDRQTLLFSATMPPRIAGIAQRHLTDPVRTEVARSAVAPGEAPKVRQTAYLVPHGYKLAALARVIDVEAPASAIVFCRTRTEADGLTDALLARGYKPDSLHGGLSQEQRDRVMRKFRAGNTKLLIATDVAARGLDISHLSHVINFHVPEAPEVYVHRTGRVGRAGREGVAITLVEPRERGLLRQIERVTRTAVPVAPLPTVAELREKRVQRTAEAVREAIRTGGLDRYREVAAALAGEFDPADVAAAAVLLAERGGRTTDAEEEIPEVQLRPTRVERPGRFEDRRRGPTTGMARVFIGAGRAGGIAPRDLLGAVLGEAGVDRGDVGRIEVAERFSLVEVREDVAGYVAEAMNGVRLRGRKVVARLDRPRGRVER